MPNMKPVSLRVQKLQQMLKLKTLGENYEKSTFFPRITHLSMELELVIGAIRKGIRGAIWMHILIFDVGFQEEVRGYFLFSVVFA